MTTTPTLQVQSDCIQEMHSLSFICISVVHFRFLFFLSGLWAEVLNWRKSSQVADLVVRNATIYTSDAALPFADSMAVRGGRILRVGTYSSIKVMPRIYLSYSFVLLTLFFNLSFRMYICNLLLCKRANWALYLVEYWSWFMRLHGI